MHASIGHVGLDHSGSQNLNKCLRILAVCWVKVDELMALCDQLEASLSNATSTRSRLLNALLAEALIPMYSHELETVE